MSVRGRPTRYTFTHVRNLIKYVIKQRKRDKPSKLEMKESNLMVIRGEIGEGMERIEDGN